jgi:23S rRNA (pseudouridine1915-N3)-methyltransferase
MIHCVFIGPFKEKRFQQIVAQYHLWLKRLWPVSLIEIPEKPKEIEKFIEAKKGKGILVSLDAKGQAMDSGAFGQWVTQASRDLFFFAWGAEGPPEMQGKSGMKSVSLSSMTYSHELARVLLMEQLYRAGAALKGHPYPR